MYYSIAIHDSIRQPCILPITLYPASLTYLLLASLYKLGSTMHAHSSMQQLRSRCSIVCECVWLVGKLHAIFISALLQGFLHHSEIYSRVVSASRLDTKTMADGLLQLQLLFNKIS